MGTRERRRHRARPIRDATQRSMVAQEFPPEADAQSTTLVGTRYRYDALGGLREIEDPAHNLTSFNHDAYGRVLAKQDPDSGTWSYVAGPEEARNSGPANHARALRGLRLASSASRRR